MTYKPTGKDRGEIEAMVGLGIPLKDICAVKGLTLPTLRKYYKAEIKLGSVKANIRVSNKLFHLATRENASAAAVIFWLKCRAGWREPAAEQLPGKKEQAEAEARNADKGTEWAGLLN